MDDQGARLYPAFPWRVAGIAGVTLVLYEAIPTYLLENAEAPPAGALVLLFMAGALAYRQSDWWGAITVGGMAMSVFHLLLTCIPWALGHLEAQVADHGVRGMLLAIGLTHLAGAASSGLGAAAHRILFGPPQPEEPLGTITLEQNQIAATARISVFPDVLLQPGRVTLCREGVRVQAYADVPKLYWSLLGLVAGLSILPAVLFSSGGRSGPHGGPLDLPLALIVSPLFVFLFNRGYSFSFPLDHSLKLRFGSCFVEGRFDHKVDSIFLECQGKETTIPLTRQLSDDEKQYIRQMLEYWRGLDQAD